MTIPIPFPAREEETYPFVFVTDSAPQKCDSPSDILRRPR